MGSLAPLQRGRKICQDPCSDTTSGSLCPPSLTRGGAQLMAVVSASPTKVTWQGGCGLTALGCPVIGLGATPRNPPGELATAESQVQHRLAPNPGSITHSRYDLLVVPQFPHL